MHLLAPLCQRVYACRLARLPRHCLILYGAVPHSRSATSAETPASAAMVDAVAPLLPASAGRTEDMQIVGLRQASMHIRGVNSKLQSGCTSQETSREARVSERPLAQI